MLPEIMTERRIGQQTELELYVPPQLSFFAGHFPGHPILPGVVQIHWAATLAAERFGCTGAVCAMENVRFQSIVLPSARLSLTLRLEDDGRRLAFAYRCGQRKCSSGSLVFHT